jgi:hypothetical protein
MRRTDLGGEGGTRRGIGASQCQLAIGALHTQSRPGWARITNAFNPADGCSRMQAARRRTRVTLRSFEAAAIDPTIMTIKSPRNAR